MAFQKGIKKSLGLSWVATALLCSVAIADEQKLETVEVWETQVTSSSINVGSSAIETKQADHLSDLLRDLPGVDVGGTHSINNRINIRGFQDENLDISLDGAKISNVNMFHHIGNLLINPDILKKADIQVGTNSVVSGSLGGSVAFETKDAKDLLQNGKEYGGRVQGNYNTNDSLGGSVSAFGKIGDKADLLLYHHYVNNSNWEDGNGLETMGAEGDIGNTLIKLGYDISDVQRIVFSYDRLKDEGDYSPRPNFGRAYNEARTGTYIFPTDYTRETISLKHEVDLGDTLVLQTTIYDNKNELKRYEKLNGVTAVRPPLNGVAQTEGQLDGTVETKGITMKAQSHALLGGINNTFTYGGLYDEQTSKVKWKGAKYGDDEEAKTSALYVEDAVSFSNGLTLTPGIRYNHYELDGIFANINDDKMTYGLSAEYAVNENLTLLASATTLYKGAEMVDVLAGTRTSAFANSNLKSETGLNKEVGFKYQVKNTMGADALGFSFKYFNTDIDDYIVSNPTNSVLTNGGDLELRGFETSFGFQKGAFNALVTYAHSDSKFKSSGDPLEEQPGDSLSVGLDYAFAKNLTLSWDSLFAFDLDKRPASTSTTRYLEKESYDVHDIAVKWKPQSVKGLTLIAGVDNIFDKTYVAHTSINTAYYMLGSWASASDYEPGRNVKLSFSYEF